MFEAARVEAVAGGVRRHRSSPGAVAQRFRGGDGGRGKTVALAERHTAQCRRRVGEGGRRDAAVERRLASRSAHPGDDGAAHRAADGARLPGRAAGRASTSS